MVRDFAVFIIRHYSHRTAMGDLTVRKAREEAQCCVDNGGLNSAILVVDLMAHCHAGLSLFVCHGVASYNSYKLVY